MKKFMFFLAFSMTFLALQAQTEISGYLDSTPADGISGAAALFSFAAAVEGCRDLVHDGKTDWYLPTFEEVMLFASVNTTVTPGCTGTNCAWNSKPTGYSWTRSFTDGVGSGIYYTTTGTNGSATSYYQAYYTGTASINYVRCVR